MDGFHGIVYFVGNNTDWEEIKKWLTFLEQESVKRNNYLKAYFVYGNEKEFNKDVREKELEKIGTELNLKNMALTFVPSLTDTESEVNLNKINPRVENTFIIYRHRTIIDKFIDLKPTTQNFKVISNTLDKQKANTLIFKNQNTIKTYAGLAMAAEFKFTVFAAVFYFLIWWVKDNLFLIIETLSSPSIKLPHNY